MKRRSKKMRVAIMVGYLVAAAWVVAGLGVDRAEAGPWGIPFGIDTLR